MRRRWALCAVLLLGAVASGQPEDTPPAPTVAGSLEVSSQLWAVIARYRYAATADRVRVTLVQPSGRSDMHSLIVRCVPGPAGLARLELGEIVVAATPGRLVAIHERDPSTYVQLDASSPSADPGAVLRALLPMLAIPQISLAFDREQVRWCPLLPDLRWESAERIDQDGERGVRLRGRSTVGEASLDLVGARVRRFEAALDAELGTRLVVECESVPPGDPATWGIDFGGRRRVTSLASLRPLGPPVVPGTLWPGLGLTLVSTGEAIRTPVRREEAEPPELHLLVLARSDLGPAAFGRLASLVSGVAADLRRELVRGRVDGRYDKRLKLADTVCGIIAGPGEDILGRVAAITPAWSERVFADATGRAPELAWSAEDSRLIDRVQVGAGAVTVMLDGAGRVLAVLAIDETMPPERVLSTLVASTPVMP